MFEVGKPQKTICENYIPLDSGTEQAFAQNCEDYDAKNEGGVAFYFKLPGWFKIPTPLGNYNPDWAVVKQVQDKVYFVAETKNTGKGIQAGVDAGKLRENERLKIECGKQHFAASSISAARAQNIQPHPLSPWLAGSGAGMVDSGFNKLCICSFSLWRLAGA